jgi:hypothetical protein
VRVRDGEAGMALSMSGKKQTVKTACFSRDLALVVPFLA